MPNTPDSADEFTLNTAKFVHMSTLYRDSLTETRLLRRKLKTLVLALSPHAHEAELQRLSGLSRTTIRHWLGK